MPDNAVTIYGIEDVKSDLNDLPAQFVRDLFPGALEAGSSVVEAELRRRTPVAGTLTTSAKKYGRLADDIDTTVRVDGLKGSARTGFGNTGFVAEFLEYGTAHAPPNPFMRQAAEAAADPATEAFLNYLAENI